MYNCDIFQIKKNFNNNLFNLLFLGFDINLVICGLMFLLKFIEMIILVELEYFILNVFFFKMKYNEFVCKDFICNGLWEYMFL